MQCRIGPPTTEAESEYEQNELEEREGKEKD